MPDIYQDYGADIHLSVTGDLLPVDGIKKLEQQIIRILLTNPGDLFNHPNYGAGLGRFIGENLTEDIFQEVKNLSVRNILTIEGIAKNPIPIVNVAIISNQYEPYLQVTIECFVAKTAQKIYLTFDVRK